MSQLDKLLLKLRTSPYGITYAEVVLILAHFGFIENHKGKTSGSRVLFRRESDGEKFLLHRSHPNNHMDKAQIKSIISHLEELGIEI